MYRNQRWAALELLVATRYHWKCTHWHRILKISYLNA